MASPDVLSFSAVDETIVDSELRSANILIADDDEAHCGVLSWLLKAEGYEVHCARDGKEALAFFRNRPPDLALLDVVMPQPNGFEVCQTVKSNPQTRLVPIVLVTGLARSDDRIQGIKCGADDFLSKPINREELLARVRSLLRLKRFTDELESAEQVLFSLAVSIEAKDPYTEGHCNRLSKYSVALGKRLKLPQHLCTALHRGGIVHDVGKVAVPEHILLKPGPLSPEERKIMERHPIIGERICAPLRSFRHVLPIIRHHHEKLDGSGYPDRLRGDEIPLLARILQVVDIYDALTTERCYHQAVSSERAFQILRDEVERGWRDGSLVDELESLNLGAIPFAAKVPEQPTQT
jgi:putative two-component system response regulator